ncbi:MAG TPA: 30S ribosomal protein S12 methylthiotransferase RimO [bacterium]|nr:30S ribosomal protein S12 methylthiotransferase RimO [bacterium]
MKVSIMNLGCPKNQKDGEQALSCFIKKGFSYEKDPRKSDVIIVNTCSFIDDAKKESIAAILECASIKKKKVLLIMGCLSQRYPEEIMKDIPEADVILGTGNVDKAYDLYIEFINNKKRLIDVCTPGFIQTDNSYIKTLKNSNYIPETQTSSSYVKVAEGCSNRCTYCVIPSIRGTAVYRPKDKVLEEIKALKRVGVKETILIAQDLSSNKKYLKDLLRGICSIKPSERPEWVRLMYCNPWGVDSELISIIKNEECIVKYIDMPVQHISDTVLKRMGRASSAASIYKKLDQLKNSGIAIRSTVMTGFPGEKASDFNELKKLVKASYFHWLGIFVYSPQEGTPSYSMKGQLAYNIATERRNELDTMQFDITSSFNETYLGKTLKVLLCGKEDRSKIGRIFSQAPSVDGLVRITGSLKKDGGFVNVLITDNLGYDIKGKIV